MLKLCALNILDMFDPITMSTLSLGEIAVFETTHFHLLLLLTPFWRRQLLKRTVAVPSAQGRMVRARGRTVRGLVRGAVVLSAQGRTVRGLRPDGPRPGARLGLLCLTAGRSAPWGRTVRAYAEAAEVAGGA
jgi:hypothetical protein